MWHLHVIMDTSCPRPIMLCFCFCRHTTWHQVKTWEFLIATLFFKHFMKHLPVIYLQPITIFPPLLLVLFHLQLKHKNLIKQDFLNEDQSADRSASTQWSKGFSSCSRTKSEVRSSRLFYFLWWMTPWTQAAQLVWVQLLKGCRCLDCNWTPAGWAAHHHHDYS